MRTVRPIALAVLLLAPLPARGQSATATRILVMQAEGRRAPTTAEIGLLRINTRSANADTAKVAVRALGRLERASLIPDLLPALRHALAEVRIEAADAIATAAQGSGASATADSVVASTQNALLARLAVEADPGVRGALHEALARLPYRNAAAALKTETALLAGGRAATALPERLGIARALETFVRIHGDVRPPGSDVIELLRQLARPESVAPGLDLLRDARVRRLANEALLSVGGLDEDGVRRAAEDADPQVRRLAMRAIEATGVALEKTNDGLVDPSPLVRIDALRALRIRGGDAICPAARKAATDSDLNVALVALDQLAVCRTDTEAVELLARIAADTAAIAVARGWHQHAHALVALATAAPDRARPLLAAYVTAPIWQVRGYAARAAAQMAERPVLDTLAHDTEDRVANAALAALGAPLRARPPLKPSPAPAVSANEIRRLAAPRARIVVRDVGRIELALFTAEAPGTVVRFVRLAEEGYYNGLSFDRLLPNAVAQGGDTGPETAVFPGREVGTWPHVRGAVGAAAPDTNDAQFFINLVDNPRFDHQYTVFAQVLNGADVVERLLEGDVIDSITILP